MELQYKNAAIIWLYKVMKIYWNIFDVNDFFCRKGSEGSNGSEGFSNVPLAVDVISTGHIRAK